jgi:hypothetical protein
VPFASPAAPAPGSPSGPTAAQPAPPTEAATPDEPQEPRHEASPAAPEVAYLPDLNEEQVARLYERIKTRLRRELLVDRERSGRLMDFR